MVERRIPVFSAGKCQLLHIEFQVGGKPKMAERLWEYNVLATIRNDLPVYSFVIYLKKRGSTAVSPYMREAHNGQCIHQFHFETIKLWDVPTAQLKGLGLKGLLPLLPLTREGKNTEVVEEVISELSACEGEARSQLLPLACSLASLNFSSDREKDWLRRRLSMLDDLIKESWFLQEILQQGREQGIEQERVQVLERERQVLVALVENRYASLVSLAKKKVEAISDMSVLQQLVLQLSIASGEDEARKYLEIE
jgi:predicted transposase YdaD